MRKILKNTPVGGTRFSLRAGAVVDTTMALSTRAAALRHEPVAAAVAPLVPDEKLVAQWRQAAERQGYEAGFKAGGAAFAEQAEQEIARVHAWCDAFKQAQATQQQAWHDFSLELAFTVLVRLLGTAAPSREGVKALVETALAEANTSAVMAVRVHPSDVVWVRELLATHPDFAAGDPVKVSADAEVRQGGCLVDTAAGTLDARLETQCQSLKDALLAAYEGGSR